MKLTEEYFKLTEKHEKDKYWDKFYKDRVNDFVLITNNNKVLAAYERMVNTRNTDCFFTENDYVNCLPANE